MAPCPGLSHRSVSCTNNTHTPTQIDTHSHTCELVGEKCSRGPFSESRFAQAVCTGVAPDCSHSHSDWELREENIEHFMEKELIRRANCLQDKNKYCMQCKEEAGYTTKWRNRKELTEVYREGGREGIQRHVQALSLTSSFQSGQTCD